MHSSLTYAALIGLIKPASSILGPLPTSTFPRYATVNTPVATDLDGDHVKVEYSQQGANANGLYRALRNDLFIFPTQNFVKAGTGITDACSIGSQSTTRTFW